jgi:hypothetical protein
LRHLGRGGIGQQFLDHATRQHLLGVGVLVDTARHTHHQPHLNSVTIPALRANNKALKRGESEPSIVHDHGFKSRTDNQALLFLAGLLCIGLGLHFRVVALSLLHLKPQRETANEGTG